MGSELRVNFLFGETTYLKPPNAHVHSNKLYDQFSVVELNTDAVLNKENVRKYHPVGSVCHRIGI
jgi:hypothetical protein